MRGIEHRITANDSTQLFVRNYSADEAIRSGRTLLILHGTSEHGGRYLHVAKEAVSRGWDVVVPDLRGHGRSEGVPVHVDQFDRYLLDLDTIHRFFELNPDRTAILAHSFGGLLAARYAETRPTRMTAVSLMSPLLGLNVKVDPATLALGKVMSVVAPKTRFKSRVPSGATTRNIDVLKLRDADPLIHRSVTARWFFEMKNAISDVWRDAGKLHVPILAMQAGADLIVDPYAPEPWLKLTGSDSQHFRMLHDHYHELLNEPDWPDTLHQVLNWLDARLPAVPSPYF